MPVVFVDKSLLDLLPGYLNARRSELAQLAAWLQTNNFTAIANLGHRWRGSGTSYGIPQLTDFGQALQTAANLSNREAIAKTIADATTYLAELDIQPLS